MASTSTKTKTKKPRRSGGTVSRMGLPNGDIHTWDLANWPVSESEAQTPDGKGDCAVCKGRCCTYVTVRLDKPTDKVDRDEIRWFLAHENIWVFIEDKQWYVQFLTRCKHLQSDGLCGIYEDRFDVCRGHSVDECEMSEGDADAIVFTTTAEYDQWRDEKKRKKREKKRRKKDKKNRKQDAAG